MNTALKYLAVLGIGAFLGYYFKPTIVQAVQAGYSRLSSSGVTVDLTNKYGTAAYYGLVYPNCIIVD